MIVIRVRNIHSFLVGNLEEKVHTYLRRECSYEVPDADLVRKAALRRQPTTREEYQERTRLANWDGRKYLFTEKTHRFPTGLLPRMLRSLRACSVDYEIVDQRVFLDQMHRNPLRAIEELRPYQREAVLTAVTSEMGTIRMPTGSGKTRVGCAIMSLLARPALFLVTRKDLLYQAIGNFRDLLFYGESNVGQIGDGVFEPNLITVATVQSICAGLGLKAELDEEGSEKENVTGAAFHRETIEQVLKGAEVVIADEVQHVAARTCQDVMEQCVNARYRYGLSATDWRDDGADLLIEAVCGPRIVNLSMTDMVALGYLVPPRIKTYLMAEHPSGWAYQGPRNWHSVYRHFYVQNTAFHCQIVDIVRRWLSANRSVLTLVVSIAHGKALERMFCEVGLPAVFLSGISSTERRATVLASVRAGELRNLIATSIADEGLDLPALDALVLAGGGKSSTRALQRIGRVLRPAPGKSDGLVAEFHCPDHEWLDNQFRKRLAIYKAEKAFILE